MCIFGAEQIAHDKGVNDLWCGPAFSDFMFIHLSVASLGSVNIYQLHLGLERVLVRTVGRECQRCVSQTEDTVKLFICQDHFDLMLIPIFN